MLRTNVSDLKREIAELQEQLEDERAGLVVRDDPMSISSRLFAAKRDLRAVTRYKRGLRAAGLSLLAALGSIYAWVWLGQYAHPAWWMATTLGIGTGLAWVWFVSTIVYWLPVRWSEGDKAPWEW